MKALDDAEHRDFYAEQEKARIPVRATFVIEVEVDSRRIPVHLIESAVADAVRLGHMRLKFIAVAEKAHPTSGKNPPDDDAEGEREV